MGTGFFVSKNGHIVTNAHVIGNYNYVIAKDHKGMVYELDILAKDEALDLALLQSSKKTEGLPIAQGVSVVKGLKVYAIGYPQPEIQGIESKITDGIISSMSGFRNDSSFYQISVPIQGGNSGGPLVTENGIVAGVVVATVNARKFLSLTGDIPQNINFAIKSDVLQGFLTRNGISLLRSSKTRTNPLAFADENTVMIAAKSTRFEIGSLPAPSKQHSNVTGNVLTKEIASPVLPRQKIGQRCQENSVCEGKLYCNRFNRCSDPSVNGDSGDIFATRDKNNNLASRGESLIPKKPEQESLRIYTTECTTIFQSEKRLDPIRHLIPINLKLITKTHRENNEFVKDSEAIALNYYVELSQKCEEMAYRHYFDYKSEEIRGQREKLRGKKMSLAKELLARKISFGQYVVALENSILDFNQEERSLSQSASMNQANKFEK